MCGPDPEFRARMRMFLAMAVLAALVWGFAVVGVATVVGWVR